MRETRRVRIAMATGLITVYKYTEALRLLRGQAVKMGHRASDAVGR